jgi:hypothetical protein
MEYLPLHWLSVRDEARGEPCPATSPSDQFSCPTARGFIAAQPRRLQREVRHRHHFEPTNPRGR